MISVDCHGPTRTSLDMRILLAMGKDLNYFQQWRRVSSYDATKEDEQSVSYVKHRVTDSLMQVDHPLIGLGLGSAFARHTRC